MLPNRRGVSLIELFVVVGVIAFLAGLMLPAVQRSRSSADRVACTDRLRQTALGLHGFHEAHGSFPPNLRGDLRFVNEVLGWHALILPYVGEDALWRQALEACRVSNKAHENPPHVGYSTILKIYLCPSDVGSQSLVQGKKYAPAALSTWVGVAGSNGSAGILNGYEGVSLPRITDGSSQTLMIGERPPPNTKESGRWYSSVYRYEPFRGPGGQMSIPERPSPTIDERCAVAHIAVYGPGRLDNPCDMYHFWSLHSGGANFAFADGSVRFLPYTADSILPALATRAGGEVVEGP